MVPIQTMRLGRQMRESIFETLIGFLVIAIAGVFVWYTMTTGGISFAQEKTVELGVRFNSASGIERGTDVRMAGVKIGTVRDVDLDVVRSEALIVLAVEDRIMPLGDGTAARIQSESLLGGSYINIEPADGFGEIYLCEDGEELFGDTGCGEILYAQGAIDLMTLFASFATSSGGDDDTVAAE